MTMAQQSTARSCLNGSESGTLTFPQIVVALKASGFDGYAVDLRRATITYYLTDGEALVLESVKPRGPVAAPFDEESVRAAIRDAQANVPGYTYRAFCDRVAAAGCAGYMVSLLGGRVLYHGRSGETHVEHIPSALLD
jgi:uncharacterized protein YbcV (DUF1398 family)